jgi:hypothetical protein
VTAPRGSYDPDDVDDHLSYQGLPLWEGFRPMNTMFPNAGPWTIDPRHQPRHHKRVKVEPAMANRMLDARYFEPCAIAARAYHCSNLSASWMPALPAGSRIVKPFWQTEGGLPASADPAAFYSWVPPATGNGPAERQYLVGMHVSEGTGSSTGSQGYLTWGTYWYPIAPGETQTRDGRPIGEVYNPHCFVGGAAERPADLAGTPYAGWHACVQTGNGPCGNPWGPENECEAEPEDDLGCEGCHVLEGKILLPEGAHDPAEPFMVMAWMTLPADLEPDVQACMSLIIDEAALGNAPYEHLAACDDF